LRKNAVEKFSETFAARFPEKTCAGSIFVKNEN